MDTATFKLPNWLRWILFFPIAVVALAITYPIVRVGNFLFSPVDHELLFQLFTIIVAYGASGFAFVWCGAMTAPRQQFMIAIIMSSIYYLLAVLILISKVKLSHVVTTSWFDIVSMCIAGSVGATLACYALKNRPFLGNSDSTLKAIVKGATIAIIVVGVVMVLFFTLVPQRSEDFKRYNSASQASASVTDLLQRYGTRDLTTRGDLTEQRLQAEKLSKLAFENASTVSREYLADSNAKLPDVYFEHFVPAMDSFRQGFAEKDPALVQQGVSHYNAFLIWIQSQDRNDFNKIR